MLLQQFLRLFNALLPRWIGGRGGRRAALPHRASTTIPPPRINRSEAFHPISAKRNPRSHSFATNLGNTAARQRANQAADNRQKLIQKHQLHNTFQETSHSQIVLGAPTSWFWPNDTAQHHEWNPAHLFEHQSREGKSTSAVGHECSPATDSDSLC